MFASLALFLFKPDPTLPFVSPTFSDHMVLQRGRENTIWGWTTPGSTVKVSVDGHEGLGIAKADGKWTVRFQPPKVGGPYTVSIDGPSHAELTDVLVGDVWICSGQSNMEFGVGNIPDAAADVAGANDPNIRLYTVPHAIAMTPQPLAAGKWVTADPMTLMASIPGNWNGFSAVAYYFGKNLRERAKVPIGLVQTCWGGTVAESWTSPAGLKPLKDFDQQIEWVSSQISGATYPLAEKIAEWYKTNDAGEALGYATADFDDSSWKSETMPQAIEDIGAKEFDGLAWFRVKFDLDQAPDGESILHLGPIDDADRTYVNGVLVGSMTVWDADRSYKIPAGILKAGSNTIAVEVLDTGGGGGFWNKTQNFEVALPSGSKVSLAKTWKYLLGAEYKTLKQFPQNPNGNPNIATVLSNGMIEPLVPLAVKGAIWYQGESNVGRAEQYRRLLPAMITDWRKRFQNNFPFFIVQLANYEVRHESPVEDAWAELRESQTFTALNLPKTGIASAIDIGERADIHPKNKKEVGRRLALAALHDVYGLKIPYSGPQARKVRQAGETLVVEFDHADGGLVGRDDRVSGFAIAGADGKYVWADARIEGKAVILSAKGVPAPLNVRYGWDSDPDVTLYNGAGLPATPFRSDGPVPFNGAAKK